MCTVNLIVKHSNFSDILMFYNSSDQLMVSSVVMSRLVLRLSPRVLYLLIVASDTYCSTSFSMSDSGSELELWRGLLELSPEVAGSGTHEEAVSGRLIGLFRVTSLILFTTNWLAFSYPYVTPEC